MKHPVHRTVKLLNGLYGKQIGQPACVVLSIGELHLHQCTKISLITILIFVALRPNNAETAHSLSHFVLDLAKN